MRRRYAEIIFGIILLMGGLTALTNTPQLAGILLMIGLVVFAIQYGKSSGEIGSGTRFSGRQYDRRQHRYDRRERRIDWVDDREQAPMPPKRAAVRPAAPPAPSDGIYRHALDAARRAGINPDQTYVLPTDVGVMVFAGDEQPVIQRTTALDDRADYLQPFVQLRLPTDAQGRVKFEIVDDHGERLFAHEDQYRLKEGTNLLSPAARLRVRDLAGRESAWRLRVYAEDTLIAEHEIEWELGTVSIVRRHLMEDGEISSEANSEMRAMMAQKRLESMSLDDLLAHQEEDEPPAQAARR